MGETNALRDRALAPSPWWQRPWVLAATLFVAILLNNSEAVFHTVLYEADDFAANSLQVLKAKQFAETVGNYSRFGFHHPGPAFFYVFGWGEALFFDAAHLVPTPFNGQLIALYALSAFFFASAVGLIAESLGRAAPWFLALALLFGAWHFGAVGKFIEFVPGRFGLFCPWPPCFIVLPFLCFIVATAVVAAGDGRKLPLLVLCAGFLVHGHVVMPLFVGPLTILAYGNLWRETRRTGQRPWKKFQRSHWVATALTALFLLPIIIDILTGHPSNVERIVDHLRSNYGQGKSIWESSLYFLHFAAYAPYSTGQPIPIFEPVNPAATLAFFLLHWRACGLWIGAILLLIGMMCVEKRTESGTDRILLLRRRMCLVLLASTALSLIWGSIQEGQMFDYNGLFNFAIYYGWLLLLALIVARKLEEGFSASRWRPASLVLIALAVVAAFYQERRRFRATPDPEPHRFFAASIDRALALDPAQPKFFNFDWQAGGQATRVALYLQRHGINWFVREDWPLLFGADRIVTRDKTDQPKPIPSSSFWRVTLHSNPPINEYPGTTVFSLTPEFDLVVRPGN